MMVDQPAMRAASGNCPLEIACFADWPSLKIIRHLGFEMDHAANDSIKIETARCHAARALFHKLSFDEKLLACSLYSHVAYFDPGMTWEMSQETFGHDLIRWKIAWRGLIEIGWIVPTVELGYKLSVFAELVQPSCVAPATAAAAIVDQDLYDCYVLYWTMELIRIDQLSTFNPSILEYFMTHLHHMQHVLSNITHGTIYFPYEPVTIPEILRVNTSSKKGDTLAGVDATDSIELTPPTERHYSLESSNSATDGTVSPGNDSNNNNNERLGESYLFSRDEIRAKDFISTVRIKKQSDFAPVPYKDHDFSLGTSEGVINPKGGAPLVFQVPMVNQLPREDQQSLSRVSRVSEPVLHAMASELAGNITNILNYYFSPISSMHFAQAIVNILRPNTHEQSYALSLIELAEQCLRCKLFDRGIDALAPIVHTYTRHGKHETSGASNDPPFYACRAMIAHGKLLVESTLQSVSGPHHHRERSLAGYAMLTEAAELCHLQGLEADRQYVLNVIQTYKKEASAVSTQNNLLWSMLPSWNRRPK